MILMLIHIYGQYTSISATDLAEKDINLREALNPDEALESLYTRINKCLYYVTAAGEPVREGQVV